MLCTAPNRAMQGPPPALDHLRRCRLAKTQVMVSRGHCPPLCQRCGTAWLTAMQRCATDHDEPTQQRNPQGQPQMLRQKSKVPTEVASEPAKHVYDYCCQGRNLLCQMCDVRHLTLTRVSANDTSQNKPTRQQPRSTYSSALISASILATKVSSHCALGAAPLRTSCSHHRQFQFEVVSSGQMTNWPQGICSVPHPTNGATQHGQLLRWAE